MSKVKVIVTTQYFENYNVGPEGFNMYGDKLPHWKPKGGVDFQIEMDSDVLMYTDAEAVLTKMVEKQNSIAERFEYRGYEIQWNEPIALGTEDEYLAILESMQEEVIC